MKCTTGLVLALVTLLGGAARAEEWTGPYLISEYLGGIKPATCKECLPSYRTCVVWQFYDGARWTLAYREFYFQYGWQGEWPVCYGEEAVNPSLAGANRSDGQPEYWCVWERREDTCGSIHVAAYRFNDWDYQVSIGNCINTDGDSARPDVVVIADDSLEDIVWAAWTNHDSSGWYIQYTYTLDDTWTLPSSAVLSRTDPIRHTRLGRGRLNDTTGCPLLVWESNGDIFYSEYTEGKWQTAIEVAHSDSLDRNPDVVSFTTDPGYGPWVTWESTRDGDTAVYGTGENSFSIGVRWCDSAGAGRNFSPCGNPASYPKKGWDEWAVAAWVSDRDGNPNIYARTRFADSEARLDADTATDVSPAVTTFGLTLHWCVWQSNRGGSWNIWGSLMDAMESSVDRAAAGMSADVMSPATIARGLPPGAVAFDAMGRRAVNPRSGICFVRDEGRGARDAGRTRKVIIER